MIDSGLQRTASYSWWTGVPALRTRPTSRASADSARGSCRSHRTRAVVIASIRRASSTPGPPFDVPEIQRADLAQTFLELKELGVRISPLFPGSKRLRRDPCRRRANCCTSSAPSPAHRPRPSSPRSGARWPGSRPIPGSRACCWKLRGPELRPRAATLCALIYEGAIEELDALAQAERGRYGEPVARTRAQLSRHAAHVGGGRERPPSEKRRARARGSGGLSGSRGAKARRARARACPGRYGHDARGV